MKDKTIIEVLLKLLFQLNKYLKTEYNTDNEFYKINKMNYEALTVLLNNLTKDEISFLDLYFDETLTIKQKTCQILHINKNDYYYNFRKIIEKLLKEINHGV